MHAARKMAAAKKAELEQAERKVPAELATTDQPASTKTVNMETLGKKTATTRKANGITKLACLLAQKGWKLWVSSRTPTV